jgi:endo-1,4-beta-xylanase
MLTLSVRAATWLACCCCCCVMAVEAPPGVELLDPAPDDGLIVLGEAHATVAVVPAQGLPEVEHAVRITTTQRPPAWHQVQLMRPLAQALDRAAVVELTGYARAGGGQEQMAAAEALLVVQSRSEPYTKSLRFKLSVGSDWTRFALPFELAEAYAPGEAAVVLGAGYGPQVLEIAGLRLRRHGEGVTLDSLTPPPYQGHEADAPWRIAAEARIERHRKGDLRVVLRSADGIPVPDAVVHVAQQRHAFGFGAAVDAATLLGTGPDADRYRSTVRRLFNRVTLENDLKWWAWIKHPERALEAVAWLREAGIEVRGHALVWPSFKKTSGTTALRDDLPALRAHVAEHIRDEVTALRGQLVDWDVVNEPWNNDDLMDLLGEDIMVEWFELADAADPGARLYINDFGILPGENEDHRAHYEQTIRMLLAQGAPLEGVGFQGHFWGDLTPPAQILRLIDRYAALDPELRLQVTEFDHKTDDQQLQADYQRDLMIALFSHPRVDGFVMWGFWEGRHWRPEAAMFQRDWTPKPNAAVFEDLVFERWWTDERGTTDAEGRYRIRAFCGDHLVTVTVGGQRHELSCQLDQAGRELVVDLPPAVLSSGRE